MKKSLLKRIIKKTHSIRTRIILIISFLTLFVFIIFIAVFNIAMSQYIKRSAVSQLELSINLINAAIELTPEYNNEASKTIISHIDNVPRGLYRIQPSAFEINRDYETMGQAPLTEAQQDILDGLKNTQADLSDIKVSSLRTLSGYYFVSSYPIPGWDTASNVFMIVYVDVTGLSNFASSINVFFFYLVASIWLLSISMAAFLSGSIAKPIRQICKFAMRIGEGDFSQNNTYFMDTELDDLNTVMNQTAKQLDIYDKDQKTFFQNASHELRTPLMSIKCYAEGIEYGLMEPKAASKTILSEADRLTDMVEDLLYVSRIDNLTSSYSVETVDLRETIKSCADNQKSVVQIKNIEFIFDFDSEPVLFTCNKKFMERAITNLISNATRYAESQITLTCNKTDSGIAVSVSDNGTGISQEDLPHIFERFYKGKNGNHGIGLSIVKSIVEQHRGTLSARNLKKGACFVIDLPGIGR